MFSILSYADLKKYRFHYWAAYPTPFGLPELYHERTPQFSASEFSALQLEALKIDFKSLDGRSKSFFSVVVDGDGKAAIVNLAKGVESVNAVRMA